MKDHQAKVLWKRYPQLKGAAILHSFPNHDSHWDEWFFRLTDGTYFRVAFDANMNTAHELPVPPWEVLIYEHVWRQLGDVVRPLVNEGSEHGMGFVIGVWSLAHPVVKKVHRAMRELHHELDDRIRPRSKERH